MTVRTRDDLFAFLEKLGIRTETSDHPPLFTVEESQALRGRIRGGHTKNLLLKDKKGRIFLVVAEESRAVDLKTLHQTIGASGRLSFVDAARMLELIGVEPGSVTAFAVLNDEAHAVTLVLDEQLLLHDMVNCHPLVNTATTTIGRDDLLRFFEATGHEPLIVPLEAMVKESAPGLSADQKEG